MGIHMFMGGFSIFFGMERVWPWQLDCLGSSHVYTIRSDSELRDRWLRSSIEVSLSYWFQLVNIFSILWVDLLWLQYL